ncbi:type II toxin-antitoxin system VapC family toxin [Caulobacter soli]|uniref:type II toxin-antitoxin system VapC family toxin n=1 Tax=Caulobacter soli TaxID=2708539 RepID=UPI0013EB10AE|nr:type II toxin-antitoxin system VapC family toxin [Caulobacter soli]
MTVVLDASALLARLLREPGMDRVDEALRDAVMCTVNLAEVVGYFAREDVEPEAIRETLADLPIVYVAPDEALAIQAGLMLPITRKAGLSLGDRFCLALARATNATALTADRAWKDLAAELGVEVELIR